MKRPKISIKISNYINIVSIMVDLLERESLNLSLLMSNRMKIVYGKLLVVGRKG